MTSEHDERIARVKQASAHEIVASDGGKIFPSIVRLSSSKQTAIILGPVGLQSVEEIDGLIAELQEARKIMAEG